MINVIIGTKVSVVEFSELRMLPINQRGRISASCRITRLMQFLVASFTRLLVNGVYWSLEKSPPEDLEVRTWDIRMAVPSKFKLRKKLGVGK